MVETSVVYATQWYYVMSSDVGTLQYAMRTYEQGPIGVFLCIGFCNRNRFFWAGYTRKSSPNTPLHVEQNIRNFYYCVIRVTRRRR